MTENEVKKEIDYVLQKYLEGPTSGFGKLAPAVPAAGKLYEAFILSRIVEDLVRRNGYTLTLVGGDKFYFKSGGGPINTDYPRIQLKANGNCVAELWTDIQFLALSCCLRNSGRITKGDYHELDVLVVDPGTTGRPRPDSIWLAVECKDTSFQKSVLKEVLGIRRELSLLQEPVATRFPNWPRRVVPAIPPSCLSVYSTDVSVTEYSAPGQVFGIDFIYQPM